MTSMPYNKYVIQVPEDTCAFSGSDGAVIIMTAWNRKDKQRKSLSFTLAA